MLVREIPKPTSFFNHHPNEVMMAAGNKMKHQEERCKTFI